MTAARHIDWSQAPTADEAVLSWVRDVAELTTPDAVAFCDGSAAEREQLIGALVTAGTLVPWPGRVGAFHCAPDAADAAQVGRHSYVCTQLKVDAGRANWMEPVDMRIILTEEFRGSMSGRTMYVAPFTTQPAPDDEAPFGVQITDSAYVVLSMTLAARAQGGSVGVFSDTDFVRCVHSVGAPRRPGRPDVAWPCDTSKYIAQFPEARTIWSYGSGFAGNALLGAVGDGAGLWFGLPTAGADAVVESDR